MRKLLYLVAVGTLILGLPSAAIAQGAAPQAPPSASQKPLQPSATQPNASNAAPDCCSSQPDQPVSLGELARLVRAARSSQRKATKIFDDDNMPRAPLTAGEKAPGFGGQDSSSAGKALGLSGQGSSGGGGKVTLLDFWATWCGPCRESLPGLRELASTYGGDNLEIISVSEDSDEDAWREFVVQNGMTWTQRLDASHEMMRQYGASALPTYVLIGRDGTVVQLYVGYDPGESLADRIGPDLKKSLEGSQ
ncbi:MAG: TlpA disulfide reductase family protein [Candidatus Acidiferrales bacterium]